MKCTIRFFSTLFLLSASTSFAEQFVASGDYVIHYNAISTDQLTPLVASHYGINRSQSQAMLNVTVLRKGQEGELDTAVTADVSVTATNLTGQMHRVSMRKIEEQDAIYYIGVSKVSNRETLNYDINVKTSDMPEPVVVRYSRQFYIN